MIITNILERLENYQGHHTAPTKESGDPLYDVTQSVYPDDIYTLDTQTASRYYGHGLPEDTATISNIQQYKNKPNKLIKIYRAVPKFAHKDEENIPKLQKLISYYNKHGFFPVNNPIINQYEEQFDDLNYDDKQEAVYKQLQQDITVKNENKQKISINPNDWVTINKQYAINHGKAELNNNYKVLTKTVKAKHIFTNGDSIHEWGYDPSHS